MPKHNITRSNTATQPLCYCTRSHPQTTVFPCNISLICSSEQRLVKGQLQIKLQNIVAIPKHICCIIMFINRPAFWHHKVLQVSGHWAQIDCDVMSKMLSIYCNNNTHVSIVCLCSCDTLKLQAWDRLWAHDREALTHPGMQALKVTRTFWIHQPKCSCRRSLKGG